MINVKMESDGKSCQWKMMKMEYDEKYRKMKMEIDENDENEN